MRQLYFLAFRARQAYQFFTMPGEPAQVPTGNVAVAQATLAAPTAAAATNQETLEVNFLSYLLSCFILYLSLYHGFRLFCFSPKCTALLQSHFLV